MNNTLDYIKVGSLRTTWALSCYSGKQNKQHMLTVQTSNSPTASANKKTQRLLNCFCKWRFYRETSLALKSPLCCCSESKIGATVCTHYLGRHSHRHEWGLGPSVSGEKKRRMTISIHLSPQVPPQPFCPCSVSLCLFHETLPSFDGAFTVLPLH